MRISSCCGCFSVKTGVIIIGVVNIICCLITIIVWAVKSVNFVAMFVTPVVHLVCGILLIMGTQNRKPMFIFPMVDLFFTDLIMNIPLISVYNLEVAAFVHAPAWYYVVLILIIGLCFGLATYFYMVIRTFYEELRSEGNPVSRMNKNVDVHFNNESRSPEV